MATTGISTPPMPAALDLHKPNANGISLRGHKQVSPEKMDAVARDFEAQFVSQMLESMFSTVDTKNALGGSESEETFRSMMISEYGKVLSRTGSLGVADQIKRDMLKLQEVKEVKS